MIIRRRDDLLWERLGGSVALLDGGRRMAHSLDGIAARVWMQCERATERGELASAVVQQGHSPIEVEQVIESLLDAELFVADAGLDRRTVLRRGLGAVAAGAVISIMLPEPAAALSVGPPAPAFYNTPGFSVTGTSSSPETPPVIDSLDSATTPLSASSSASVYVASDPSLGSLVWPAAFDAALNDGEGGWVFGVLDIQSEVDFMFSDDATATAAFLGATSFRIDFYDETPVYKGTAYFPTPT